MPRYRAIPRRAEVADLRQAPGNDTTTAGPATPTAEVEVEVSYRDLQARAKALGIPGNQTRDDLEAAIAEAER
jgi:hypothetical protein